MTNPYEGMVKPASSNPYDDLVPLIEDRRRRELRAASVSAEGKNPDEYARAAKLADGYGVAPEVVADNMADFEQRDRLKRLDALQADGHGTAAFLKDPRRMGLASDDVDNLHAVEKAVKSSDSSMLDGFWERMKASSATSLGGIVQQVGENIDDKLSALRSVMRPQMQYAPHTATGGAMGVFSDAGVVAGEAKEAGTAGAEYAAYGREQQQVAAAQFPRPKSLKDAFKNPRNVAGYYGGMVADSTFPMLLSMLTRNPGAGAVVAGATTSGSSYSQFRSEGESVERANAASTTQGMIEALFSVTPLAKAFGPGKLPARIASTATAEAGGESATQILQDQTEVSLLGREMSWQERISNVVDAAVVGSVMGAPEAVLGSSGSPEQRAVRTGGELLGVAAKGAQSADGAAKLASIVEAGAAAKLGERSPADMQEFAAQVGGDGNVYIAADMARTLFQSERQDAGQVLSEITGIDDLLGEAETRGGDVAIPIADFIAKVSRLPNAAEIAKHARMNVDDYSAAQLDAGQLDEDMAQWFDSEPAAEAGGGESAQRVQDDVLAQLMATNRYAPADAERQAHLIGTMFRALGSRTGQDPWALYEPYKLQIGDGSADGDALNQAGIDFGDNPLVAGMQLLGQNPESYKLPKSEATTLEGVFADLEQMLGTSLASIEAQFPEIKDYRYAPDTDEIRAIAGDAVLTRRQAKELADRSRESARETYDPSAGVPAITGGGTSIERAILAASLLRGTREEQSAILARLGEKRSDRLNGVLYQSDRGSAPRGQLTIGADRGIRIGLLEKANLTTFLHESAHFFLEVFNDTALQPDAPQQVRDDFDTILQWGKVEGDTPEARLAAWSTRDLEARRDLHEMWAEGFEQYLQTGKAPSPELVGSFARFKAWITAVYRGVKNAVTLTPEVTSVFDRLLATDAEIDLVQERLGMKPLDLSALGLTERQSAKYLEAMEAATEEARADVAGKLLRAYRREADAAWKEELAKVRSEVEAEFEAAPATRAWRILTARKAADVPEALQGIKLSGEALKARYEPSLVHAQLRGTYSAKGGLEPDTVAALLEFPSGDALIKALANVKDTQALIGKEALARMRAKYPDPATDGSLPVLAERAAHNHKRVAAMQLEIEMLAQLAGESAPPARAIKAYAQKLVSGIAIKKLRPNDYLVAERKAAREATKAAAKNDFAGALKFKRDQAVNASLYREASAAQDKAERGVNYLRKFDQPKRRERMGKAGLLETIDSVLEAYSFRAVSDKARARASTLAGWYDRMLGEGIEPQVPTAVLQQIEEAKLTHYRDMTVSELQGVVDTIKQLELQAQESNKLRLAGEEMELEAAASELSLALRNGLKDRGPPPVSETLQRRFPERAKTAWRKAGAILLRLRTLAHWVDGEGNTKGPFYRMIIRPLDRAQAAYLDAMQDYGDRVVKLFDQYLKGQDITAPIWIATLNQNLTKSDILAVALNTGNESNLQRLMDGRGWGQVQMTEILGHMTREDVDFVNNVHVTLESLWPQIAAQQKRLTGVAPPKIEGKPYAWINNKGERLTVAGGYYPVIYDRDSTEWKAFVNADADSFFDPMAMTALPPSGHTKARVTKAKLPIKLDLSAIPQHLSSIIKDLSHRETVLSIRKLMKHEDVVSAMVETLGPEYTDMVEDKLRQVATDQIVQSGRSLGPIRAISRGVRRHVGIMAQGLSVSSGMKQVIGFSNSIEVMSARHGKSAPHLLMQGYGLALQKGSVDAVMVLSGEMRHRIDTADVDIRNAMNRYLAGKMKSGMRGKASQAYDGAIAHAYILIRYMQTYIVDIPLWLAAHEGALKKGMEGDDAISAADDAVITAQGAGGAKDTSLIEGQIPVLEWFTMFYSYGSAYLNRQVSMGRQFGKAVEGGPKRVLAELPLLSARGLMLMALPVVLDDLISQAVGSSEGPDDDEWAEYYSKRMFAYLFYGVPGARDIANAKFGYKPTPMAAIGDAYMKLAADVKKAIDPDEDVETRKFVRDAVNVAGYTLGLPLQGPFRHVDYMWRWFEGEEEPDSIPEFAAAVATGKREER